MRGTAEEEMGMDCLEEYIIEGISTVNPGNWQFVRYSDECSGLQNPSPTLEKALATVRAMKETIASTRHSWEQFRIVRKFTYT
ncbi:hypothetical protein ABTP98_19480, partial [Acinetobacter baumannii]